MLTAQIWPGGFHHFLFYLTFLRSGYSGREGSRLFETIRHVFLLMTSCTTACTFLSCNILYFDASENSYDLWCCAILTRITKETLMFTYSVPQTNMSAIIVHYTIKDVSVYDFLSQFLGMTAWPFMQFVVTLVILVALGFFWLYVTARSALNICFPDRWVILKSRSHLMFKQNGGTKC